MSGLRRLRPSGVRKHDTAIVGCQEFRHTAGNLSGNVDSPLCQKAGSNAKHEMIVPASDHHAVDRARDRKCAQMGKVEIS